MEHEKNRRLALILDYEIRVLDMIEMTQKSLVNEPNNVTPTVTLLTAEKALKDVHFTIGYCSDLILTGRW